MRFSPRLEHRPQQHHETRQQKVGLPWQQLQTIPDTAAATKQHGDPRAEETLANHCTRWKGEPKASLACVGPVLFVALPRRKQTRCCRKSHVRAYGASPTEKQAALYVLIIIDSSTSISCILRVLYEYTHVPFGKPARARTSPLHCSPRAYVEWECTRGLAPVLCTSCNIAA